ATSASSNGLPPSVLKSGRRSTLIWCCRWTEGDSTSLARSRPHRRRPARTARAAKSASIDGNSVASLPRSARRRCHIHARATTSETASSRREGQRTKRKQMRPCSSMLGRMERKRVCKAWRERAVGVGKVTALIGDDLLCRESPKPGAIRWKEPNALAPRLGGDHGGGFW